MTTADLEGLPLPIRGFLRRAGVVGRPRVQNVRAHFRGLIRSKLDGPWMPFTATQHDYFDRPARVFLLSASRGGLPFEALHFYADGVATMEVKVASLVKVVDARGPEMNHSETVTFFNDMCVLAPGSLISPSIAWEPIDATHTKGTLTCARQSVSAVLTFDENLDLVCFDSNDRMMTDDGKVYRSLPWSTPLSGHRDYDGVRLPQHGDAQWKLPEGDQPYGRFEVLDVAFDV